MLNSINLKKRCTYFFILLALFMFAIPIFAKPIKIVLNGKTLTSSVAPIQKHGTTLVPLRLISENLGAKVNYDQSTSQITLVKGTKVIKLTLNSTVSLINNQTTKLSLAPKTINNTTMVPLRFVSENLDCSVNWNAKEALIILTSTPKTTTLPTATLVIKDYGTITLELYPKLAPNTVNNFIALANSGYYDGLIFHRIINNFMIQGGDPTGTGMGGPDYAIAGEFTANGFTANTLSHTNGIISMARTQDPNSASSQFFITSSDASFLDGQYAAFGKVIAGLDIINKVQKVKTDSSDKPLTNVVIESIRVNTNGISYPAPTKITP